jgi:hypothetical protein
MRFSRGASPNTSIGRLPGRVMSRRPVMELEPLSAPVTWRGVEGGGSGVGGSGRGWWVTGRSVGWLGWGRVGREVGRWAGSGAGR